MKKISEVLIESQKTRKQHTGKLVMFNKEGKIESYCALGALACESGLITNDTHAPNSTVSYNGIIKSYGADPDVEIKDPDFGFESNLISVIYRLNDRGMKFEDIGKWIKKLEKKGVIKYAWEKKK